MSHLARATVIEHVSFRLRPDVDPAAFAAADALADTFLAAQPGFVWRTLTDAGDGSYIDLVGWTDRSLAEAASAAFFQDAAAAAFGALIDPDSVVSRHLAVMPSEARGGAIAAAVASRQGHPVTV